ncbi:MAG: hypothetical protein ACOCU8_02770 [Patescibacteria group bacterium]
MDLINNLLSRYKKIKNNPLFIKEEIIAFLKLNLDINIKPEDIKINIKDNKLFIQTKPIIKNEIILNKDKIIDFLNKKNILIKEII